MTPEPERPRPMVHKTLEEWRAEHRRNCPECRKDPERVIS
jgi:hypothetical protein